MFEVNFLSLFVENGIFGAESDDLAVGIGKCVNLEYLDLEGRCQCCYIG